MGISEDTYIYTDHFGLDGLPFENVPDPAFFFDQGDYTRVLEHLIGCFRAGRGLMVVVGPIGSGKTTLSQRLLLAVPANTKVVWLVEPPEGSADLFLLLLQELGGEPRASQGRAFLLRDLRDRLLDLHTQGGHCLTLIDEAHKGSDEVLEAVRLLNNLEHGAHKLVQIILLGQDEFLKRLSAPALISFHQRIAALEVIGKMDPGQVRDYILHRLEVAGGRYPMFTDEAIEAIARSTGGIPRVTNSLCDRALMASFGHAGRRVDIEDVREAAKLLGDVGVDRELFYYVLERKGGASPQPRSASASVSQDAFPLESTAAGVAGPGRPETVADSAGRPDGKIESIPALNRSLQPADVPVNTPITNDRVRSTVDLPNETAGGSPPERDVRRRHRGNWLGSSAAIAGIVSLGLFLAWNLYDGTEGWPSQNLVREEATETIPKPAARVPLAEQRAPDSVAQGREDPAGEPTLSQPSLDQHIGTLLKAAKADLDAGRLNHPPGGNAIEKYRAVLAVRPDVEEAKRAIQDIAARLISAAREALDRGQWETARTRLDESAVIAPESETVASLREELKARETALVQQRLVEETRHLQAEETPNKLVALDRKALQANDIKITEAHSDRAFVIRPVSEQVAKLRGDLETHKLRAQEDHKRRVAERPNEEEGTVKKPLDLARPAINEHDLQTGQTRLDEAAGIAPKSEAVASLRDEFKARETALVQQRLVEETRHLGAEVTTNKLVALGRKALQTSQVSIRAVTPSRVRVRPGETVGFYTEYSLTLPASDKEALVEATWVLLRNGRKIGREGIDNRHVRAGLNTAVTELTLPLRTASGQYTVEHRVQVGDSFDVAHSRFVLAR